MPANAVWGTAAFIRMVAPIAAAKHRLISDQHVVDLRFLQFRHNLVGVRGFS
jgi:hypothetical protein